MQSKSSTVTGEGKASRVSIEQLNKYYIYTDGGSQELEAKTLAEAIAEWGEAPKSVRTVEAFESWLEKCGGYGGIEENGIQIAAAEGRQS